MRNGNLFMKLVDEAFSSVPWLTAWLFLCTLRVRRPHPFGAGPRFQTVKGCPGAGWLRATFVSHGLITT